MLAAFEEEGSGEFMIVPLLQKAGTADAKRKKTLERGKSPVHLLATCLKRWGAPGQLLKPN